MACILTARRHEHFLVLSQQDTILSNLIRALVLEIKQDCKMCLRQDARHTSLFQKSDRLKPSLNLSIIQNKVLVLLFQLASILQLHNQLFP